MFLFRWTTILGCGAIIFGVSGCLDLDALNVQVELEENLSGTVTLAYTGVRSDKTARDEQVEEMQAFFKNLDEHAQEQASIWALHDIEVVLNNRTEVSCDVTIRGKMRSLVQTMVVFLEAGDFTIARTGNRLKFDLPPLDLGSKDDEFSFSLGIQFPHSVGKNNATNVDQDQHLLVWSSSSMASDGLYFELEIKDK